MIHRGAVLAIIVLFTLALVAFFADDSLAGLSVEKRFFATRGEDVASHRLGGSVLPTTGDPDEPSTWKRHTTGGGTILLGENHWGEWRSEHFRFGGSRTFLSFLWMYLRGSAVGVF